jgi:hypothetical protein
MKSFCPYILVFMFRAFYACLVADASLLPKGAKLKKSPRDEFSLQRLQICGESGSHLKVIIEILASVNAIRLTAFQTI